MNFLRRESLEEKFKRKGKMESYLSEFHINKGSIISDYTINNVTLKYKEIEKNREYSCVLNIKFMGKGSEKKLLKKLRSLTSRSRIIKNKYSYRCTLGKPVIIENMEDYIVVEMKGYSHIL